MHLGIMPMPVLCQSDHATVHGEPPAKIPFCHEGDMIIALGLGRLFHRRPLRQECNDCGGGKATLEAHLQGAYTVAQPNLPMQRSRQCASPCGSLGLTWTARTSPSSTTAKGTCSNRRGGDVHRTIGDEADEPINM